MIFVQTYENWISHKICTNLLKLNKFMMEHQLEVNISKCANFSKPNCVTNLLGFINSYKLCAKFDFHKFVQKLHELCVMVNMNDIRTYSISFIYKQMKLFHPQILHGL